MSKRIVFFEPEIIGHQPLYIRLLCDYIANSTNEIKAWFVVNPNFRNSFKQIVEHFESRGDSICSFIELTEAEFLRCTTGPLIMRAKNRWKIMLKYLEFTNSSHGHFLYFDHLQLLFALQVRANKSITFSGILFSPSVHYKAVMKQSMKAYEKLKSIRKSILYYFMLLNPSLTTVFTLDPYFTKYFARHIERRVVYDKIAYLRDPSMFPRVGKVKKNEFEIGNKIDNNRICFMQFGALTLRKGILQTLGAIRYVNETTLSKIAIIFAGKLESDIKRTFLKRVEQVRNAFPRVRIYVEDRYIGEDEIVALVERCDVMLLPYQRFVGSSGVLLWAIGAGKCVIVQNYGMLGKLTKDYDLGLTVDTTNAEDIARAIETVVEKGPENIGNRFSMSKLHEAHRPEVFGETVIKTIIARLPCCQ